MENFEKENVHTTPMGPVWAIVILSMCVTFSLTWIWHIVDMKKHEKVFTAMDTEVIENTKRITLYRDVLKNEGKEAAQKFLMTLPIGQHGN